MKNNAQSGKLKKYIYSGIGLASHSREIVQNLMNDMVRQNKLNETEGKKIVANAVKNMQGHLPDIEGKYHQAVMKVVKLANAEIQMLQKGISRLENTAEPKLKGVAKKVAAKKTSARLISRKGAAVKRAVRKAAKKASK